MAARRVGSLDAARGVMLITSVASDAVLGPRPAWLGHTTWLHLTAYDWIFPLFVTLSGCGMAFAFRNQVTWTRNVRRVATLVLVGLVYNWIADPGRGLAEIRVTGVLQLYAALVLLVALLHHVLRTASHWAIFTLFWSLAFTVYWYAVSRGCADGIPQPRCNPTLDIDGALFGLDHLYRLGRKGFEPEGILGVLGALTTTSAGVTAGHLIKSDRHQVRNLLGWTVIVAAAGFLAGRFVPAIKWLWTPAYGLQTATLGLLLLTAAYLVLDRGAHADAMFRLAHPLRALGRNSLLVYFGSHTLMMVLTRGEDPVLAQRLAVRLPTMFGDTRVTFTVLAIIAWWALALLLDRRRIYLRA